jgi:peptidyl-prolyl cis-trans isomerase B (cyclophilin B)
MMFKDSDFGPNYIPFGKITSGLDVLTNIAKAGTKVNATTGANDEPKKKVTITKVTITSEPKGATAAPTPKATGKATAKPSTTPSTEPSSTPKASKTPKASSQPSTTATPTSTP